MYWYKLRLKHIIVLACGVLLSFCGSACKPEIKGKLNYFDINKYFSGEISRLSKSNKPVVKTAMHNGVSETQTVSIHDWGNELNLFVESDINKPAWKNSYTVDNDDGLLFYKAKEPDLKVREMIIKTDNHKVKWILIFTKTENFLHKTVAKLSYFPDSLYKIEKQQHIKLLGTNTYFIQGLITSPRLAGATSINSPAAKK